MVAQREPHSMTLDEYFRLMRKNLDAKYEYLAPANYQVISLIIIGPYTSFGRL